MNLTTLSCGRYNRIKTAASAVMLDFLLLLLYYYYYYTIIILDLPVKCFHFIDYVSHYERGVTDVLNPVVSPTSEGGRIHLNLVSIRLVPTIHFDRQSTSSLFEQTTIFSTSICFHVFSDSPPSRNLQPQTVILF